MINVQAVLWMVVSIAMTACGNSSTTSASASTQAGTTTAAQNIVNTVALGNWSGSDTELNVTANGATLDLGCGSATLSQTLTLDSNNSFKVYGTYSSGLMGGVVSINGTVTPNQPQFALISGSYNSSSKILTLTITIPNTDSILNPIELSFGNPTSPIIHCY